jgi:hypothetical protein
MLGVFTDLTVRVTLAMELQDGTNDVKTTAVQAPVAPRPATVKPDATSQVKRTTSVVAPLLDEAMKYDGRGSFGCVAVNPPTFLSEDEAIELIRTELEAAGLKLKEGVDLDHVEVPLAGTAGRTSADDDETDGKTITGRNTSSVEQNGSPRLAPQTFTFDLADTDRSVFIEYLSLPDHREWTGPSRYSVTYYDFPALATKVSKSFQKVPSDKRRVFGVFFDPLARTEIPSPDISNLTEEQQHLALLEYRKALSKEQANSDNTIKEKLRKQVRSFVVFLNQEGIIAKTK